ncbi:MAG: hypothetical protein ICV72_11300, partial [Aldersonia sp.]|nr:hypothetical protein [Aldersonia sp.]
FEQHGFLNLLLAAATAEAGASVDTIAAVLALRDVAAVATRVQDLDPVVRASFVSYGTCSVLEPMIDLVDLNLVDRRLLPEQIHPEGVTA